MGAPAESADEVYTASFVRTVAWQLFRTKPRARLVTATCGVELVSQNRDGCDFAVNVCNIFHAAPRLQVPSIFAGCVTCRSTGPGP